MKHTRPSNRAVLTPQAVREIRGSKEQAKVEAINRNVSEATISLIRNGKRWGWVR